METLTTCPRGHPLAENAVYCTVCWIRVEPEDPAVAAARRKRKRRLIVGIPLLGAGSIAVGIALGSVLANAPDETSVAITALPPSAPVPSSDPATSADQPIAVVAEPLAATVEDPVEDPTAAGCVAVVRDGEVACSLTDGRLEFSVCVPGATALIRVGTRPNDNVTFEDASSEIALGARAGCPSGEISARVSLDSYNPEATWRIVGRDASDQKIWKSRVVTLTASP